MSKLNLSNSKAIKFADICYQIDLAAAVSSQVVVPGDNSQNYTAEFSIPESASVWVAYNSAAVLPTAGVTTSQYKSIERNPRPKYVRGGDILNFISTAAVTDIGLVLYTIGN